jgi:hypothetical protein
LVSPFGEHDFCNDPKRDGSVRHHPSRRLAYLALPRVHNGDAQEAKVAEAYENYLKSSDK